MLVVAFGLLAPSASAQEVQPYEYARPGQPTMTIYVWGSVSKPGIWVVEREATLVEILSLVNVQTEGNTQAGVRADRFLRVYRASEGAIPSEGPYPDHTLIYEMPIEEMLISPQPDLKFRDEDILAVEIETHRTWFTLRNISSVIGTVASLTLLIIRLSDL